MRKQFGALFGVIFFWSLSTCSATTIFNIVDGVTENSYSNHLASLYTFIGDSRGFTDGASPRTPLPKHDLARDYMISNFTAMGYDTWLDPFEFEVNFSYDGDPNPYIYSNCNNVVATKWGHGGTNVYLLVAHYDSVDSGHRNVTMGPGADDGASGVAALLEIAQAIQNYNFRNTIVIVAFDAEEKDYQGAIHFKDNHLTDIVSETNSRVFLRSSVKAVINLDSIAYDDTNTASNVVIGKVDNSKNPLMKAVGSSMSRYTSLSPVYSPGYNSSDHIVFDKIGIDSVHVIEYDFDNYWDEPNLTPNPYYHTDYDAIDAPDFLKLDYAAEITKGIVGTICEQAQVIPPATLISAVTSTNTFEIYWSNTPGVSYSLYATDALSTSNTWSFIQSLPGTNTFTQVAIQIDLNSATQRLFRVISE